MSSIVPTVPSFTPSGVEEIKEKMFNLSKDLDKFAPEHRNQVMADRLRQQKLRAMISLAKAQHYLAETDVLIADYNLQAVADEFEHMKKERCNTTRDMSHPQNLGMKEDKLVTSIDCAASSAHPKDVFCDTSLLPAVGNSKSKEKGTELTSKLSTELAEAHKSKSDAYTPTPKYIQPMNEIDGPEPTSKRTKASSKTYEPTTSKTSIESSSKTKEAATSKTYEASSKNKDATTSKNHRESSSKTRDSTVPKTYKESSSKIKESTISKTYEAAISTKVAAADTDVPAPELKSKKRKRSKSKSKESKRHKSSRKHASSSHATAAASNAPAKSTLAPAASSNAPAKSTHVPAASSNAPVESTHAPTSSSVNATLGPAASVHAPPVSSNVNTALLRSAASTHVHALHVPNCDCLKPNTTCKVKTLLNTSISPIKRVVEAKGVQTDRKASKNDIVQTDGVKTLTKAVQTDHVIILQVGSETVTEKSPDIADEETLLLDTLPAPHSHSTAISLAKALQQIKSQKSVLEHVYPTEPDVSQVLSQSNVLQKFEVIVEDEVEKVKSPVAVKMEVSDGDRPNTSTELLVNNLYKDIMKAKDQETKREMKPKGKVTKRGLWKVLDKW